MLRSPQPGCIGKQAKSFAPKHVAIPVAGSAFPDEICAAPRNGAEKAYPNLDYFNRVLGEDILRPENSPELLSAPYGRFARRAQSRDARWRQPVDAATLRDEEIRERMSGNVCRCGVFSKIVAAVRLVLAEEMLA